MDNSFSNVVAEWQNFYILAGTASATLIGLMFVAVSIHLDIFVADDAAVLFASARRTFGRFIIVLTIALVFVVPDQSSLGLGLPLLSIGITDILSTFRLAAKLRPKPRLLFDKAVIDNLRQFSQFLPLVSGIGICFTAVMVLRGNAHVLYWMVGVIAVILTNVAQESWDLMFNLAKIKSKKASTPA